VLDCLGGVMYKLLSQGYLISGIYKHTSDP
jgi:hypothetical protein